MKLSKSLLQSIGVAISMTTLFACSESLVDVPQIEVSNDNSVEGSGVEKPSDSTTVTCPPLVPINCPMCGMG